LRLLQAAMTEEHVITIQQTYSERERERETERERDVLMEPQDTNTKEIKASPLYLQYIAVYTIQIVSMQLYM